MKIVLDRHFVKRFNKLPASIQRQFSNRRDLFIAEPFHPLLDNHPLHGEYADCRSFNVNGDFRVVFFEESPGLFVFLAIGTHHDLYGK